MKFNSYFVNIRHEEPVFTGKVSLGDVNLAATFTRIEDGLYTAHFKTQIALSHHQSINLRNRDIPGDVRLPVLSKYNKRKLKKIARFLLDHPDPTPTDVVLGLLQIEKFLEADRLLDFFAISRTGMLSLLVAAEIRQELKLIETDSLLTLSYENFQFMRKALDVWLEAKREKNVQTVPLTHVEAHLKIPQSSLLFRFLLSPGVTAGTYRLLEGQLVFARQGVSEKEKQNIRLIEEEIQRSRKMVFSIDDLLKTSGLSYPSINSAIWYLLNEEEVVRLNERDFIFKNDLVKIINRLKKYKRNQGDMLDIKTFREMTLLSRKSIIPLLEYFDTQEITVRVGDRRRIKLQA